MATSFAFCLAADVRDEAARRDFDAGRPRPAASFRTGAPGGRAATVFSRPGEARSELLLDLIHVVVALHPCWAIQGAHGDPSLPESFYIPRSKLISIIMNTVFVVDVDQQM